MVKLHNSCIFLTRNGGLSIWTTQLSFEALNHILLSIHQAIIIANCKNNI